LNVVCGVKATIRDSVVSGGAGLGVQAFCLTSGATAELNIEGCLVAGNTFDGVVSAANFGGAATLRIGHCIITDNQFGLHQSVNGVLLSRGDNLVGGNGTDVSGTIGPLPGH
jgi:hypothetical protein